MCLGVTCLDYDSNTKNVSLINPAKSNSSGTKDKATSAFEKGLKA